MPTVLFPHVRVFCGAAAAFAPRPVPGGRRRWRGVRRGGRDDVGAAERGVARRPIAARGRCRPVRKVIFVQFCQPFRTMREEAPARGLLIEVDIAWSR